VFKNLVYLFAFFSMTSLSAYHYGLAGCGLGAVVFEDQPGPIQVVAATVNNLVSPQTSAITSGTSNCYDTSSTANFENYIESNLESLKSDIAKGDGETLNSFLNLIGCENQSLIKIEMKNQYNEIFKSNRAETIYGEIKNTRSIASSCKIVG